MTAVDLTTPALAANFMELSLAVALPTAIMALGGG